jgi:hypothetical protein
MVSSNESFRELDFTSMYLKVDGLLGRFVAEKLLLNVQDTVFLKPQPDGVLARGLHGPVVQVVEAGAVDRGRVAVDVVGRKKAGEYFEIVEINN